MTKTGRKISAPELLVIAVRKKVDGWKKKLKYNLIRRVISRKIVRHVGIRSETRKGKLHTILVFFFKSLVTLIDDYNLVR